MPNQLFSPLYTLKQVIAASLGLILVACTSTRSTTLPSRDELAQFVLVIRQAPNGQATHSWERADEFDISSYELRSSAEPIAGRIILASAQQRDCHAEYMACHRECKKAKLPASHRHIPRGGVRHDSFCWERCQQPYMDCERLQELQTREFSALDEATGWLTSNYEVVLAGSLVVIAGVVFVVVSAGVGLVILVPAVLVAS